MDNKEIYKAEMVDGTHGLTCIFPSLHEIVDSTISTPYHFLPFDIDVNIIKHSTSIALSGKNDHIGGVLLVNPRNPELAHKYQVPEIPEIADFVGDSLVFQENQLRQRLILSYLKGLTLLPIRIVEMNTLQPLNWHTLSNAETKLRKTFRN